MQSWSKFHTFTVVLWGLPSSQDGGGNHGRVFYSLAQRQTDRLTDRPWQIFKS